MYVPNDNKNKIRYSSKKLIISISKMLNCIQVTGYYALIFLIKITDFYTAFCTTIMYLVSVAFIII